MSTYSQIYIQIVFAVKGRESLIYPSWEERLYKYITGIVQNKEQKPQPNTILHRRSSHYF
jgi:hypothetical protein